MFSMCHFLTNYSSLLNNLSIFIEGTVLPLFPCGCECMNVTVANLLGAGLVDACGGLWIDSCCRYCGGHPLRRNHC
jgi:hypothetical protein